MTTLPKTGPIPADYVAGGTVLLLTGMAVLVLVGRRRKV